MQSQRLGLGGVVEEFQPVTQPLHGGPRHENAALQGIGDLAIQAIGDGAQQPVLRVQRLVTRVEQQEAAGAVGTLGHALLEAALTKRRCLLVACDAGDGHGRPQNLRIACAEIGSTVQHLGQQAGRHIEQFQQLLVPALFVNIEQECP